MKTLLILIFLGFSLPAFCGKHLCTFSFNKEAPTLEWTAFKTPKKVGVKAKFTDFNVEAKNSATLEELLSSATITVNSQSVNSGDKARDTKIMTFFFKKMLKGTTITGKVLKATPQLAQVEFQMNGVSKVVDMPVRYDEGKGQVTLNGKLNVLEFGMKDNLATLTKACFEKHEGVTWPDVEMEFIGKITKSCN